MRDEVLAEWIEEGNEFSLHIYLHVSGGLVFGWARMRDKIFRSHLPLVLKVIRFGDDAFFMKKTELDEASIIVHFKSPRKAFNKKESYGKLKKFRI